MRERSGELNKQETLDYLAEIEGNGYLGIIEKIDFSQSKIILPDMDRKRLSRLFRKLGFTIGVEVGVYKGTFSECICKCNPSGKLYGVDAWRMYDKYQEDYTQEDMENYFKEAKERLANYNCELIREFSMDAVKKFEDESIDFVYIDGAHDFQNVTNDIAEWSRKVRPGGIVAGHDYVRYKRNPVCHVKDVVNAWIHAHKIDPLFITRRDKRASWFYIK